jgi:Zn-dependent protease
MQLFRVRGIPVRIDFGWLLIFALISWSLASGYFPYVLPSQSPVAYWVQGLLAAALLFTSVLLHELAHALVAIRHGVPVGGITLHVFGGVSELEAEPETPRDELLIAVAGPFASFVIAGAAYGVFWLLTGPPWADAIAGYVAVVNVVVGVFNLLPAFPLDGGRVLRAALWAWSHRVDWATRVASRVGSLLALLMVVIGIARALAGEVMGGLWFALIGLFLHQGARSSYELVRVRSRLAALRVVDVMNAAPAALEAESQALMSGSTDPVVSPQDSAWHAFLKLSRHEPRRVAVVDGGAVVGVVTPRDLQPMLARHRRGADVARRAA